MAINWDLYNKRLNINGSSNRERNLNSLQNTITNKLPDSLSYKAVKINDIDASIEIVKTTKDYLKVIHSLPNETFDCGDYVLFNSKTYLITEIDADDEVYTSGKMQECTFVLKFQSPSGTILSYPCIDESSSGGVDENKVISVLDGTKRIKCPFCLDTDRIKVDDRFFVDKSNKSVYKVININNTEYSFGDKGLIIFTMKADEIQLTDGEKPKDRPDLGVCNYFEPIVEPEPEPSPSGYTLTIASSGDFNLGTTRTLTPTLKDSSGNVVLLWTAVWTVDYNLMTQSYFSITYVGNQCKVKVSDDAYDVIDETLELTCTVDDDTVNATYSGKITA